jgi:hypothetical protein
MTTDDVLALNTCWSLLRSVQLGRVAMVRGDVVELLPVNFVVDHGTVVFRTAAGSVLSHTVSVERVAFEADGHDSDSGQVWSVVVKGAAEAIGNADLLDTTGLALTPWAAGPKHEFIRIVPSEITGRRFIPVESSTWHTPLDQVRPVAFD